MSEACNGTVSLIEAGIVHYEVYFVHVLACSVKLSVKCPTLIILLTVINVYS